MVHHIRFLNRNFHEFSKFKQSFSNLDIFRKSKIANSIQAIRLKFVLRAIIAEYKNNDCVGKKQKMQGFIISINRARDEDLVVTILSDRGLDTLYRFYGARHGVINLGFKIDFEIITNVKSTIGQLRDVLHIAYPWLGDHHHLRTWQQFTTLFYPHLKESEETSSFYFELLDYAAEAWSRQNPKRIAVESYVKLLEYEGRLHKELYCFFCDEAISGDVSLIRSYLPAHPKCAHTLSISQDGLKELFENHSSLFLSDQEIDRLWMVLLEGI